MRFRRRPSKASRRAALAAYLNGRPDPPELPTEIDTVVIREDGRLLTGGEWVKPSDYQTEEVANNALPSLKGCTPPTLPSLDDQNHPAEG